MVLGCIANPQMIIVVQRFPEIDEEYGNRTANASLEVLVNQVVAADVGTV